jgi:hypothetical protein
MPRELALALALIAIACATHQQSAPTASPSVQSAAPAPVSTQSPTSEASNSTPTASSNTTRPAPADVPIGDPCASSPAEPTGKGLTPRDICTVVTASYASFRACYESSELGRLRATKVVSINWSVSPAGSVTQVTASPTDKPDDPVASCLTTEFQRLAFPTSDKQTNAGWTFAFRPKR